MTRDSSRDRAHDLVAYCDGLEQAGLDDYARRGRVVARDLLRALDELHAERSCRQQLQARCEAQQEILGLRVVEAIELLEREQPPAPPPQPLDLTAPAAIRELTAHR